jgi:hypothetical protein
MTRVKYKGKIYITPSNSNNNPINNVSHKLLIVTMSVKNYQNIVNVSTKVSKKIKMIYISQ